LRSDDGSVGLGEAAPRPSVYGETAPGIVAALRDLLLPPVVGTSPFEVRAAWSAWRRVVGNATAKAAVDTAMHDMAARATGVPLFSMLGGPAAPRPVPLTAALGMGRPDEVAIEAREAREAGYAAIKVKVGLDLAHDREVVGAVRAATGELPVYVDANGGYSRLEAMQAMTAFTSLGVALFEEPLRPNDSVGRARLAAHGGVPLLLDETANDPERLLQELAAGCVGAVSLRALRAGFTGARDVVALTATSGVPLVVGSHRELGIGTLAGAHLALAYDTALPAELGAITRLEHSLLLRPPVVDGGELHVPAGPGLGADLDPVALDRYRRETVTVGSRDDD
jgi:L-Ala-D/L-Glu epimerase